MRPFHNFMKNPDFSAKSGPNPDQFAQKSPDPDQSLEKTDQMGALVRTGQSPQSQEENIIKTIWF